MDLFLTMAGEYSRFKNEGYQIPKFLLPWGHRTILSELLNQFMDYKFDNVYLIMHKRIWIIIIIFKKRVIIILLEILR